MLPPKCSSSFDRCHCHLAQWDEDTFPAFQNLEPLLGAIEPLGQVLDAADGSIVELLGRRLMV